MEIKLKAYLEEYKKNTIELLDCLDNEDYDLLDYYMNKRQLILDELSKQNYDKENFSKMFGEFGLAEYEKKLDNLMITKRDKIKDKINTLVKSKNANNMYNKNIGGALVFSKKI